MEVATILYHGRSQVHRFAFWGLVPALVASLLIVGCGSDTEEPTEIAGIAIEQLTPSLQELVRWQIAALDTLYDPPGAADLRCFYELRQDLLIADRQPAAVATLRSLLDASPRHFLWLEVGLVRRDILADPGWFDDHVAAVIAADSTGPVARFAQARRASRRIRGYEAGYFRAAEQREELDPLQRIWLESRLVMVETDSGDQEGAMNRLERSLREAWLVGGRPLAACWWFEISKVTRRQGRLDDSLAAAQIAIECARRDGNQIQEIRGLLARSRTHQARAEYIEARATAAECMRLAKDGDHGRWIQDGARLMVQILDSSGDRRGALRQCEELYDLALAVADTPSAIGAGLGQAIGYLDLGVPDSAAIWIDKADELDRRGADGHYAGRVAMIRWQALLLAGEYDRADSLLAAVPVFADYRGRRHVIFASLQNGLDLGRPDLVYRCLSLARADTAAMTADPYYNPERELARIAAVFHAHQGEFELAYADLARVDSLYATGISPNERWDFENCHGQVADLEGDDEEAASRHATALAIAEDLEAPDLIGRSRMRMGEALVRLGRLEEARALFAASIDSPDYWSRLAAHLMLGCVDAAAGDHDQALASFAAAEVVLRADAPGELTARLRLEQARSLAATGRKTEALERLASIQLASGSGPSPTDNAIQRTFFRPLHSDVAELTIALRLEAAGRNPGEDVALVTLAVAESARWRVDPASADLDPAEIGRLPIDAGSPLVAFFLGRQRSFAWVGTSDGWSVREIPDLPRLLALVRGVQTDMRVPDRDVDWSSARELAVLLLGPVLEHWRAGGTLHVLAPGILEGLPWPALPLADGIAEENLAVDRGPIVHLASLRTAPAGRDSRVRRPAGGRLLAVGFDDPFGRDGLRHAEAEARAVAALWPGAAPALRVGDQATWSRVVDQGLADYDVIHLASHAVVSEGVSGSSVLRLAGASAATPITIREARGLDLDADLVFLSCCEGGRVRWDRGTGLDSFARAFLQAGARTVIASACVVEDEAARDFAVQFYRLWSAERTLSEAMNASQRQIRTGVHEWRHPFYWAYYQMHTLAAAAD